MHATRELICTGMHLTTEADEDGKWKMSGDVSVRFAHPDSTNGFGPGNYSDEATLKMSPEEARKWTVGQPVTLTISAVD